MKSDPFDAIRTATGPWPGPDSPIRLRHVLSTAAGPDLRGDSRTAAHAESVAAVAEAAGLPQLAWAYQVHGGTVLRVDAPGCAGEADALWTDVPGLGVAGRSADCPIVLVAGAGRDGRPVWGMAHASWRSTVAGITTRLLEAMVAGGLDPASAVAGIAPSAGPCCYEVGDEVREAALGALGADAVAFFAPHRDRWILDLWRANVHALTAAGLPADSIAVDGRCTICGTGFPSHRREGEGAGRFAAVVGVV